MFLADIALAFKEAVDWAGGLVWSTPSELPWLVVLLLGTGIYVTIRMRGIQFREMGHAVRVVSGKYDDPNDQGDLTHFQALTTALSATVGIGNIAGVAIAIHFGGPGAVFWMWITAIFGMCLKYVEVTLAMNYRDFDAAGNASGGPQKYILKGLGQAWAPMAVFFAVCAIISSMGAGNMNQINTMADAIHNTVGLPFLVTGVICALVIGSVILGGIKRIGRVTGVLMPVMAVIYVLGALAVLFLNIGELPAAFGEIFSQAFSPKAGFAGTAAGAFSTTLLWGVKRGLFSNEAGQGSAPIAHASAKTDEPLREGLVAMLGPFIDTLVICSMTALVIIVSGVWDDPLEETMPLGHKDLKVMTWNEEQVPTVLSFQRAGGIRVDVPATIEFGGYDGDPMDGTTEDSEAIEETLVITNGLPDRLLHKGTGGEGAESGAILVRNDCAVVFGESDHRIMVGGKPWSGELTVKGGEIQGAPADAELTAGYVRTGQDLTASAFKQSLGGFGGFIVTLTVILFALSTAISWSYYGDRCTEFLFGIRAVLVYRVVFLGFVVLGAVLPLQTVWDFGDLALGLMTIPNLIAVFVLGGQVKRQQDDYLARMKIEDERSRG